jgi:polyphosphate kinase
MDEMFAERIFPGAHSACGGSVSIRSLYLRPVDQPSRCWCAIPKPVFRQFARVKVPTMLSRFISLAEGRYVPLEDVIAHHLDQLFSGMEICAAPHFPGDAQ